MRATGFACDVCKTFATSKDDRSVPKGWMTVAVSVDQPVTGNSTFHICSNKCLRDLGTARWRAERESGGTVESNGSTLHPSHSPITSAGREITPEGRAAMRQNGLRIQHNKGNHADTSVNADCLLCQQELAMTAEEVRELLQAGQ